MLRKVAGIVIDPKLTTAPSTKSVPLIVTLMLAPACPVFGEITATVVTNDLVTTVDTLRASGVPMMTAPPATYYEMLDERLPGHGENVDELQKRGVLVDGTTQGGQVWNYSKSWK